MVATLEPAGKLTLAALAEEVKKNAKDIVEIKNEQAKLSASFSALTTRWEETEGKIDLLVEDLRQRQLGNQFCDDDDDADDDEQYGY